MNQPDLARWTTGDECSLPWLLSRGHGRGWLLVALLGGGFVLLGLYALAVLCGVRGMLVMMSLPN